MRRDPDNMVILGIMFIGCPSLYVLWRSLPYLVFYVAPFLLAAGGAGLLWKIACNIEPASSRRLAFLFPLTACLLFLLVGFPSSESQVPLASARIQSPELLHAFNNMKSGVEGVINWSWLSSYRFLFPFFLPPEHYQPVLYDLPDLAWVLWLAVFFASPLVFLSLDASAENAAIKRLMTEYEEKIRREVSRRDSLSDALDQERRWSKDALEEKDKEIEKLKAVAAAVAQTSKGTPGGSPSGSENPPSGGAGGVFGTDFL